MCMSCTAEVEDCDRAWSADCRELYVTVYVVSGLTQPTWCEDAAALWMLRKRALLKFLARHAGRLL